MRLIEMFPMAVLDPLQPSSAVKKIFFVESESIPDPAVNDQTLVQIGRGAL